MLKAQPNADARGVARAAARWLVRLDAGQMSEQDHAALQCWRQASEHHENAWHQAQALKARLQGLPSALAMASLDRPQPGRRHVLKGMLGLAVAAPAGWLATRELPVAAWRADVSTGTGERRVVPLAGGSVLQLNTATAVNIDASQRRVTLIRGEIALRAAGTQPLLIDTAHGRATLAGGAELCVRQDAAACEFSLFAGHAQVQPERYAAVALNVGQRLRISDQGVGAVGTFDVKQAGWREGIIVALDQPLGDFLRELDRYRRGILRWPADVESLRVTGTFRVDDPDRVLALLAASLPLQVQWRTRYWASVVPKKKTA